MAREDNPFVPAGGILFAIGVAVVGALAIGAIAGGFGDAEAAKPPRRKPIATEVDGEFLAWIDARDLGDPETLAMLANADGRDAVIDAETLGIIAGAPSDARVWILLRTKNGRIRGSALALSMDGIDETGNVVRRRLEILDVSRKDIIIRAETAIDRAAGRHRPT
jgi:hypothetical protein